MVFVGAQSIKHARYQQIKTYHIWTIYLWGGGGTANLWGHVPPPPPPVATPLFARDIFSSILSKIAEIMNFTFMSDEGNNKLKRCENVSNICTAVKCHLYVTCKYPYQPDVEAIMEIIFIIPLCRNLVLIRSL